MVRSLEEWRRGEATAIPGWVKPQLTKLVDAPPEGAEWLHEIKFDGYRMHARLDRGAVRLLTRTGLDWTHKYPAIAAAVASLPAREAYLDGELCGIRPDGSTSFSLIQNASDTGNGDALVFFLFDLLHLDGEPVSQRPISERKERLRTLLSETTPPLQFSDHQIGRGRAFYEHACGLKLEGIVSKRGDAPYAPGNRGLWLKVKCLNREEFVVVGWTDPEGTRPHLGALLLAYYDPDGRLIYAGRAGTGIGHAELERRHQIFVREHVGALLRLAPARGDHDRDLDDAQLPGSEDPGVARNQAAILAHQRWRRPAPLLDARRDRRDLGIRVGPCIFRVGDQPIDRPALDLVRRPRPLISGRLPRVRAPARQRGSVGGPALVPCRTTQMEP
jgi:DNA ligase D-like protein (predicted ligase)